MTTESTVFESLLPSGNEEELRPAIGSLRERDNNFYAMLGGGARLRLIETALDLGLFELIGAAGSMTAEEIVQRLSLQPHRTWKYLHCLALADLLDESNAAGTTADVRYRLSNDSVRYFGEKGDGGYFFRELVAFWRAVAILPTAEVLRGMPLPAAVQWPPADLAAAEHLETWMRASADGAIASLEKSNCMEGAKTLLDVGGGDGTIGCALAKSHSDLRVTVYNLPASAYIARRTIGELGMANHVSVFEGDFINEELPSSFDRVMFSRVLTDWSPDVCRDLLQKAGAALAPGGRLIINEALLEGNRDYALSWEFRYIFYDTFGRFVYKSLPFYESILKDAGLRLDRVTPMSDSAFYSVIEAVVAD